MPLKRSRIRSDAKLASGMGLEAAGRRLPGFDRNTIPVGTRQTGSRGQDVMPADMGADGPLPGNWRRSAGTPKPTGHSAY
eukprot:12956163-Heterocapsa_arctica.AAC.1